MLVFLACIEDENQRDYLSMIYHAYKKDMLNVANRILSDHHEAEDVVQNAIIKIADNTEKIRTYSESHRKAFVVIVVRNLAINVYNKRRKTDVIDFQDFHVEMEDIRTPETIYVNKEESMRIARELDRIKPEYADVLTMKYTYDLSTAEIAKLINTSEANVRVKLMRAKQAMFKVMGGESIERTS